ncbi:hypothetical protein Aduo_019704 [Ancylostoma duodenale]
MRFQALDCLRERTSSAAAPCQFFAHGTDDIVAKSSVGDGDNGGMRKFWLHSISIRAGHAYSIQLQQCLLRTDYERGYKYSLLAIRVMARVVSRNPALRHRTVAGMLVKRWISTLYIFVAGITDKVGGSLTSDDVDRLRELCKFIELFTHVDCIDNDGDINNPATPLPERIIIPAIDVCINAAAAEKIANVYMLYIGDISECSWISFPVGSNFEAAIEEMEIAHMIYLQSLELLDAIHEKIALKWKARILANFATICLMEFHVLLNQHNDLTQPQFMADQVTIQYEKIIDKLETKRSVSSSAETAYSNCLLSLGKTFMLTAERYIEHPQRTAKAKAMTYLKDALRTYKTFLQKVWSMTKSLRFTRTFFRSSTTLSPLKSRLLKVAKTTRLEMRRVANEDSQLILSFYDHMLTMVSDPGLPLKQRNFTFEICVLHQDLMDLPYVKDNLKIYGSRQVLTWLKQMVPIILTIDGVRATAHLREVWDLVVKLLSNMLEKLPQYPFVKKSVGCVKRKKQTDHVEQLSKLILDSVDEVLAVFPSVNIAAELEGVSW